MSTVLLTLLLVAAPGERELIDRIAAVVNEEIITLSEVEAAAQPFLEHNQTAEKKRALYNDVLDQLIGERLLSQQVKEAQVDVTEEEVDRAIKDILKQNKITMSDLRQAVEAREMSMGQYKEDLKSQLRRLKIVDMKVRSRVQVSEKDIKAEYDSRFANEEPEAVIHIRHLLFRYGDNPDAEAKQRALDKALGARKRIVSGEDFAAIAKEMSEGPTAQTKGGDLGEVKESGLMPALAKGLVGAKKGDLSQPIITTNGVHVVEVLDRKKQKATTYASVRDKIYTELYTKEVERQMKVWLDELKKASAIDVRM